MVPPAEMVWASVGLRKYSAIYASMGVPLEIVSKVIPINQNLKTTQIYLDKVSEHEAIRWMEILHGIKRTSLIDYEA